MTLLAPAPTSIDDALFVTGVEHDINNGVKRTTTDLHQYAQIRLGGIIGAAGHWRHKESGDIYTPFKVGFAATGKGYLALMVHYHPYLGENPGTLDVMEAQDFPFERQYAFFLEKFEPVKPTTVWEKA